MLVRVMSWFTYFKKNNKFCVWLKNHIKSFYDMTIDILNPEYTILNIVSYGNEGFQFLFFPSVK